MLATRRDPCRCCVMRPPTQAPGVIHPYLTPYRATTHEPAVFAHRYKRFGARQGGGSPSGCEPPHTHPMYAGNSPARFFPQVSCEISTLTLYSHSHATQEGPRPLGARHVRRVQVPGVRFKVTMPSPLLCPSPPPAHILSPIVLCT